MEDTYEPHDYIIFRRMSKTLIPGFSVRMVASFGIGLVLGIFIFVLLGLPTHTVEAATTLTEQNAQKTELEQGIYALQYLEALDVNASDTNALALVEDMRESYLSDLSDEEINACAEAARNAGLTSQSEVTEASAHLTKTKTVQETAVPLIWRVLIASAFPLIGAGLFVEHKGATLAGELLQRRRNAQSTKTYFYRNIF